MAVRTARCEFCGRAYDVDASGFPATRDINGACDDCGGPVTVQRRTTGGAS